jgi:hypothetical protein
MNYKVGDPVTVTHTRSFLHGWPFWRFWMPRSDFNYGRAGGSGTIIEVIRPSQGRGIANVGGYKVRLANGTAHYYSEAELRPTPDKKKWGASRP